MKKQFQFLMLVAVLFATAIQLVSCTKTPSSTTPTPTPTAGKFTCKLGDEDFSAPDPSIAKISFGGTIAVTAKDTKNRTFSMAIFEKDFPVNKEVNVAYSPSISYKDDKGVTYISKSGTMTVSAFTKDAGGALTNMKGTFSIVLTADGSGRDIVVTSGVFDVPVK